MDEVTVSSRSARKNKVTCGSDGDILSNIELASHGVGGRSTSKVETTVGECDVAVGESNVTIGESHVATGGAVVSINGDITGSIYGSLNRQVVIG